MTTNEGRYDIIRKCDSIGNIVVNAVDREPPSISFDRYMYGVVYLHGLNNVIAICLKVSVYMLTRCDPHAIRNWQTNFAQMAIALLYPSYARGGYYGLVSTIPLCPHQLLPCRQTFNR